MFDVLVTSNGGGAEYVYLRHRKRIFYSAYITIYTFTPVLV